MKNKHFGLAFCSLIIVGLGQIIKGQSKKGLILLLSFYFLLPALSYLSLNINGFLFLYSFGFAMIIGISIWLYSIWEALL